MTTLTLNQLIAIMPRVPVAKRPVYLNELNKAMPEFHINTPVREAAFLAQLAHESGELQYFRELGDGKAYEGRKDLGNIFAGDGPRFLGRGPIQLTGRANYARASKALGIDLVANPDRAADADVGFKTACWFWDSHALSPLADAGNFVGITKIINGGFNGLKERQMYWATAKKVLGVV
jgi:putative chitinase